jgi:hypothetical protein
MPSSETLQTIWHLLSNWVVGSFAGASLTVLAMRTYLSERIKGSIKDEYDERLERFKAELKRDNDFQLETYKSLLKSQSDIET